MLLALMALAAALIFTVQAAMGSSEPVSFAVPPEFVPVKFRNGIREILLTHWNPEQRASTELRAYERYVSANWVLASRNTPPEKIAATLESLEIQDGLRPGSHPAARLLTAQKLLSFVNES